VNLIYISNTRIPSEKANTYQSMLMCEAFSQSFEAVKFWYPNMRNTEAMNRVQDAFEFYNVEKCFEIETIDCVDSDFLFYRFDKAWFIVRTFSFVFNYLRKLRKSSIEDIVFTRDMLGINLLGIAKRLNFVKQKVYFEAHVYSEKISEASKSLDGLIVINEHLKKLYEKDGICNILVAHDGVKLETFKEIDEFEAKKILRFDENTKYLTYVGRFNTMSNEKGIPEIIEAFSRIQNSDLKLLFIGGPLENILEYILPLII